VGKQGEIRGEIRNAYNTIISSEMEFGEKEFSKSKSEMRRNSRGDERKQLLERMATQEKGSMKYKRSPVQLRRALQKEILQDQAFQEQPLNSEIPLFSNFTVYYYAAGTQRLFIKDGFERLGYT
jgi:hypothetical protein